MTGNSVLAPSLLDRIDVAATESFESRESFITTLIELGLQHHRDGTMPDRVPRARRRDGGKDPAKALRRPVNASSKRGGVLRYFLDTTGGTVRGAMAEFGLSRSGVFTHWSALNRAHGIGYTFDSASDAILVRLPCNETDVFEGKHVA